MRGRVGAAPCGDDLADHLGSQFHGGRSALVVHPHVDRQPQWAATPGRGDPQGDDHQVEPPGVDDPGAGGAHCVAEGPCAVDRPAGLLVDGVVAVQDHRGVGGEHGDGVHREHPPQRGHAPPPDPDEPVVGVVRAPALWVSDGQHPGDGAPSRGEDPAGQQVGEHREAGRGEHRGGQPEKRGPAGYRRRARSRSRSAATPALACASSASRADW